MLLCRSLIRRARSDTGRGGLKFNSTNSKRRGSGGGSSGLPKFIFLAIAEAEGEGGKTSALEVKVEGEAEGLVFCI